MAYVFPSITNLIQTALADIAANFGYTPLPNAPETIVTTAAAGMADDQYKAIQYYGKQAVPYTTDSAEYILGWAAFKGITQNQATFAHGGAIAFAGTTGVTIAAGTTLTGTNQQVYATNASFTIGTTASVDLTATVAGSAGNAPAGIGLILNAPQTGVVPLVPTTTAITSGADLETFDSLKSRMLQRFATQPTGGNVNDYIGWALAVSGVTRAWAVGNWYPAGTGSVTVYPMLDVVNSAGAGYPIGTDGTAAGEANRSSTIATGDQLTIANAILPYQPVTALVIVASPQKQNVDVVITGLGLTNVWNSGGSGWTSTPTTLEAGILAALHDILLRLGTAAGGTIYTSDLVVAIESVNGAGSFTLSAPTSAIVTGVGYLPFLHSLTFNP